MEKYTPIEFITASALKIYSIGYSVSALYFMYQYAKELSFLSFIFIGTILSLIKAAIWPIVLIINLLP